MRIWSKFTANFWILVITFAILSFSHRFSWIYYPNFLIALGASESMIGIAYAVGSISFALVQVPGGSFADRFGRKLIVVVMTWGIVITYLIIALAPSWHVLLVASFISGIVRIYIPALRAILQDSLCDTVRAQGILISTLVPSFISIPSPWISGYILGHVRDLVHGYRLVFMISFVLASIAAIMRMKLREVYRPSCRISLNDIPKIFTKSYAEIINTWKNLSRSVKMAMLLTTIITVGIGMYFPYLIRIATGRIGISDKDWGIVMSVALLINAITSAALIPIADRVSRRSLVLIGSLVSSLGLLIFYEASVIILPAVVLVLAIGSGLAYAGYVIIESGYMSYIVERSEISVRGRLMALDNIIYTSAEALGSSIAAVLYPLIYEKLLLLPIILGTIYGVLSFIIMRR